ncbi:MAG: AMP-binding protein [Myxococcales bacterium]|nr:AMP-binding protein [Myxococcales bacterium]
MRLYDHLVRAARSSAERPAIVFGERRIGYPEYLSEVSRAARAFLRLGVQPQERVALLLPNWPQFCFAALGAMAAGGVAVMLNLRLQAEEIRHQLEDSGSRVLVLVDRFKGRDYLETLARIRERLPALEKVIVVGTPQPGQLGYADFLALADGLEPERLVQVVSVRSEDETLALLYTSGTTGRPKGVMFGHGDLIRNCQSYLSAIRMTAEDRRLTVVPMYHTSGMVAVFSTILAGAGVVLLDDFSADECWRAIERERCTVFGGVPTILTLMLRSPLCGQVDASSLRVFVSFGAPLPPALVRAARERGLDVLNVYGMTELGIATLTQFGDPPDRLERTVGRAAPHVELKIADRQRRPLPDGEVGELAVRSRTMMKGYFGQPEATRACFDAEGFFYTRDLARRLPDGYLEILGRLDDMYIRGGVNVYPKEIEDVLATHPAVQLCAVVGVPDPVMGEVGRAFVVLRPGKTALPEELRAYLAERIADYKVPAAVEIRDALPLNSTGKIIKKALRPPQEESRS